MRRTEAAYVSVQPLVTLPVLRNITRRQHRAFVMTALQTVVAWPQGACASGPGGEAGGPPGGVRGCARHHADHAGSHPQGVRKVFVNYERLVAAA